MTGMRDKATKLDCLGCLICDKSRIVTLCHKQTFTEQHNESDRPLSGFLRG